MLRAMAAGRLRRKRSSVQQLKAAAEEDRSSAQQLKAAAGCHRPCRVSVLLTIAASLTLLQAQPGFCSDPSQARVQSEPGATQLLCDPGHCSPPPTPLRKTETSRFPLPGGREQGQRALPAYLAMKMQSRYT